MRRIDGHKRSRTRAIAAGGLVLAMLTSTPASTRAGDELQLGGVLTRAPESAGMAETLGENEIGAGSDLAIPKRFAPSSVGLPLGSAWIDDVTLSAGAAGAGAAPPVGASGRSAEQAAVGYFTPRFSGLQFGASYAPPRPAAGADAGATPLAGQESASGNDIALGVNYLDTFWGVDVALTGGYRSSALPGTNQLDIELSGQDAGLHRYSVGTSIGFSGLRLGGSFARDVGDGLLGVQSWDAGVSYVSGPWTIGVDYLQSDLIDTGRDGADGEALQAVQAGLTYAVGPGIVASFNVMHSSLEDREGNADSGTLGILGFSYNF